MSTPSSSSNPQQQQGPTPRRSRRLWELRQAATGQEQEQDGATAVSLEAQQQQQENNDQHHDQDDEPLDELASLNLGSNDVETPSRQDAAAGAADAEKMVQSPLLSAVRRELNSEEQDEEEQEKETDNEEFINLEEIDLPPSEKDTPAKASPAAPGVTNDSSQAGHPEGGANNSNDNKTSSNSHGKAKFLPMQSFLGSIDGYSFQKGELGQGYYLNETSSESTADADNTKIGATQMASDSNDNSKSSTQMAHDDDAMEGAKTAAWRPTNTPYPAKRAPSAASFAAAAKLTTPPKELWANAAFLKRKKETQTPTPVSVTSSSSKESVYDNDPTPKRSGSTRPSRRHHRKTKVRFADPSPARPSSIFGAPSPEETDSIFGTLSSPSSLSSPEGVSTVYAGFTPGFRRFGDSPKSTTFEVDSSFGMGSSAATSDFSAAPTGGFSFGKASASTGGFSFGKASASTGGFSFGKASASSSLLSTAPAATGGFSFGKTPAKTSGFVFAREPAAPTFEFGGNSKPSSASSLDTPTHKPASFKFGSTSENTSLVANRKTNAGSIFGVSKAANGGSGHSSSPDETLTAPFQVTTKKDKTSTINLHSITAMEKYETSSFEELRLKDYSNGNRGLPFETRAPAPFRAPAPVTGGFGSTSGESTTTSGHFGSKFGQQGQPAPLAFHPPTGRSFSANTSTVGFGALAQASNGCFGQPAPMTAFGAPASDGGSFGIVAAPNPTGGGFFRAPAPSGFGAQVTGGSFARSAPAGGGVFGKAVPFSEGFSFGASAPSSGGSSFGGSPESDLFGQSAPTFGGQAPSPNFGGSPNSGVFGQSAPTYGARAPSSRDNTAPSSGAPAPTRSFPFRG